MTARAIVLGALAATLALVGVAPAQFPAGSAQLTGTSAVAVRRCGADREPNFSASVAVNADGTWSATDGAGDAFAGTWAASGSGGRRLDLFFDAATEADLVATVAEDVGMLCELPEPVTVTSTLRKRFTLALNRRLTVAKVIVRYAFKGHAGNRSGSARYRVQAKGPFVAAS